MLFKVAKELAMLAYLAATAIQAVKVNPWPAPQSIAWGSSWPKEVAGYLVLNTQQSSTLVSDAWNRAANAINTLKWTPAAAEAPVAIYKPFSSATESTSASSAIKRQASLLIEVDLTIDDITVDLQQGADESYTQHHRITSIDRDRRSDSLGGSSCLHNAPAAHYIEW